MIDKRLFIIAALSSCMFSCTYKGYKRTEKVKELIGGLNWKSFDYTGTYVQRLYLKNEAKRIIALKDDEKLKQLCDNIIDSPKTVVIHVILTELLEPKKSKIDQEYHYNKDTIDQTTYTYNNLNWTYIIQGNSGSHRVSRDEIQKIEGYWRAKIKLKDQ